MKKYKILTSVILMLFIIQSCKREDLTHGFADHKAISISNTSLNISVGDTTTLSIVYNSRQTASENENRKFTWSLEGPAIISITNNTDKSVKLEGLAEGSTQLKVVSEDGSLSSVCDVIITKANLLEAPVYIDFGTLVSEAPWNNLQNFSTGAILGLADENGTNTGINIEITDAFNDQNTSGVTSNTLGFPSTVSNDAFWGDSGNPTAVLKISNLNRNQKYNFSYYASRADVSDNRETAYTAKGSSETTVYLNASSNKSQLANANNILPDTDGVITITVKAGPNNNNASRYYYLNALIIGPAN